MPVIERDSSTEFVTADAWIARHPYLHTVAALDTAVKGIVAHSPTPPAGIPKWSHYSKDYHAGIPLLDSTAAAIDLSGIDSALRFVIENLAFSKLPGSPGDECRTLRDELSSDSVRPHTVVPWLLRRTPFPTTKPGLLRYLGWSILAHWAQPLIRVFDSWRDEERWLRTYCPTCGSPPAMAQLVGIDPGRLRLLFCGHCLTRWRYRRTACPFCEISDDHMLLSLAVQGEAQLRIDYCDRCKGYLKTYVQEGNEGIFLADWTSIHLDVIACDRGLERIAGSLYQFLTDLSSNSTTVAGHAP
jgi:FdhE protein